MDPETGKLYKIAEITERVYKAETIPQILQRAEKNLDSRMANSEPLPGSIVPENWPRFNIGDEVGPIKGWWMKIESIDIQYQTITIKPNRRSGKEKVQVSIKKRRKRKKGK